MNTADQLLDALATGSRTRAELQSRLGVSQPTVSRLVAAAGERLARIGRGPATRYAARRPLPSLGDAIPMYRVDADGQVHVLGQLLPLAAGEYACAFTGRATELQPGLPHFLQDMRPQGYMGRAFAQRFASELRLPPRLSDWDDAAHLAAMAFYGEDLAGNLVVGEASLARYYQRYLHEQPLPAAARARVYPQRAAAVLEGEPGSSAGGEQPKFTAFIAAAEGGARHVLVKFTPAGTDPAARRWRDLLRAEHHALALLNRHGIAAARSTLLAAEGRLFLEVERFDRLGARGRRGLRSLAALDDHHFGRRGSWSDCAGRLQRAGMLTRGEARTVRLLDTFGALIANSDRHFGNLSLFIDDFAHALAPAYDMLPMAYRPSEQGEVLAREFQPPLPSAANAEVWAEALALATAYWSELAVMPELEAGFREIAAANAETVERLGPLQPPA